MFKCLVIYNNTPLSSNLQSPMQILQSRSVRSDLPISYVASHQLGLNLEQLRSKYKNEHLPAHNIHLNQHVMYQDWSTKQWHPATIISLCIEPRIYIITTKEGVQYRKHKLTWNHINPRTRRVKMNIYHNLIICGQSKMRANSLILLTV